MANKEAGIKKFLKYRLRTIGIYAAITVFVVGIFALVTNMFLKESVYIDEEYYKYEL